MKEENRSHRAKDQRPQGLRDEGTGKGRGQGDKLDYIEGMRKPSQTGTGSRLEGYEQRE